MTYAIGAVFVWLQALLAPVLAVIISVRYFRASPDTEPLPKKLLVSAHGVVVAVLYFGAMSVMWSHQSSEALGRPFDYLLPIPVLLGLVSLLMFRGGKQIHWLLVVSLGCLLWTAFVGSMAVTGDFL